MNKVFLVAGILLGLHPFLSAQMTEYAFQRSLTPVKTTGWYELIIPEAVLPKLKEDLSDIRIFKISAEDTVEVPYLLAESADRYEIADIPFQMVNKSTSGDNESFVTFRPEEEGTINHIELEIRPMNYDLLATLEGSNNRLKWFIIEENVRLVGISNDQVSYHFSTLNFADSDYKFFRVKLNDAAAEIVQASVGKFIKSEGEYQPVSVVNQVIKNDTDTKTTEITLELKDRYPVSRLAFEMTQGKDFYRAASVSWLKESVETQEGVKEVWRDFGGFTLSSLEENVFDEEMQFTSRLKISVYNYDDIPLDFGAIKVFGPAYSLQTNLEAQGNYVLVYQNPKAYLPRYDMVYFQKKIPDTLKPVLPGEESPIVTENIADTLSGEKGFIAMESLLWVIMGLVILVLGFFTVKMMRNSSGKNNTAT
ncbi:MAG: hypothetical protein SF052_14750 [Bacteroidia bacterium]|nr:hypothetical protein [Bacteroidia bacterium]